MRVYRFDGDVAEPTATMHPNGYVTLDWPDDAPPVALINRELLLQMVADLNEARGLEP